MTHQHRRRARAWTSLLLCASLTLSACGKEDENNSANSSNNASMDMSSEEDMGGGEEDMSAEDMGESEQDMPAEEDMGEEPEGLSIEGLSGEVSVNFDANGVLHLRCETNEDCFAAQGYFHAAHRFAQMDLRRRLGRGKLSTLLAIKSDDALALEKATRRLLTSRDGRPLEDALYDNLDAESRGVVDAYTRGVNAWLDDLRNERNGAALSEEYDFAVIDASDIPAWEPQDSLAVGLLFLNGLVDRSADEIRAGQLVADYDEDFARDMFRGWHLDADSSILTASGESYDALGASTGLRPAPRALDLGPTRQRLRGARDLLERAHFDLDALISLRGQGPFGSNSWATAPDKNAGDHAILSNDPHLSLTNPSLWYLAELDARSEGTGDFHAAGVSFAGLPGIMIGYSEEVAWSATVAFWDLLDVYVEELSPGGEGVMFNGEEVPFVEKEFTFQHAQGEDTETFLFVPHHGPVVEIDREAGVAITVKSKLADSIDDLKLFVNLGRQTSMEDAKALLSTSTAAGFSFTLIDRQGTIAYYPFAAIPRREWDVTTTPAWLPLPGTGEYEWGEQPIRADELPQMENPPAGFIATANAAITDDMLDGVPGNEGYPPLQTVFMAPGARQARIVEVLSEASGLDADAHLALQGDTHIWLASELLPGLLTEAQGLTLTPAAQRVVDALTGWDYTCPTGLTSSDPMGEAASGDEAAASIGCAAFHVLLFSMASQILDDELAQSDVSYRYSPQLLYWVVADPTRLAGGESYWDDTSTMEVETRADTLTESFEQAAVNLEQVFGSATADDWRWGRIHTLTLGADLLNTITGDFDNGPYAAPGGLFSVNVADPIGAGDGAGSYAFAAGPSMRMVVEGKAEGFEAWFQLPGGQVHRRDDPNYEDLLPKWLVNEPFTMPFTPAQVDAASTEALTIAPAP